MTDCEKVRDEVARLWGWKFRHNQWWHPTIVSGGQHPHNLATSSRTFSQSVMVGPFGSSPFSMVLASLSLLPRVPVLEASLATRLSP
jgi:hypothetical protein